MTILTKITSSIINNVKSRIITAMGYNVVSGIEIAPAGVDFPPTAGLLGLYIETAKRNSPVMAGYINKNQLASPGERRVFAADENGNEISRIWMYDKIEVGGTGAKGSNVNHAIQYEALNTILQAYLTNLNIAITAGVASGGGSYTPPDAPDLSTAMETTILLP